MNKGDNPGLVSFIMSRCVNLALFLILIPFRWAWEI